MISAASLKEVSIFPQEESPVDDYKYLESGPIDKSSALILEMTVLIPY
jgi:hypothetical protein